MRDAKGQRLVWIQAMDDEFAARNAGILTVDEARRIAGGIARLPELMHRPKVTRDELREYKEFFSVAIHVQGPLGPGEEVARLNSGTIGLKVFDAFVRAFPGCALTMSNGTHRLRVHEPDGKTPNPKDPIMPTERDRS